jgi:hypothetical protein
MPYFTRKRIQRLQTSHPSYVLYVDLNDEDTWERYNDFFEPNIRFFVRGKVGFISDKEDKAIYDVRNTYDDFYVRSNKVYDPQTRKYVCQNRVLHLPESLTNGFGLRAGMGIEITLNEFIKDTTYLENEPQLLRDISKTDKRILADVELYGDRDFELKGINGELLNSSEVLVSTKFMNEFYVGLATEINTACKMRLLTSTMVLLRKLFENLLLDMFREKYSSDPTKKTFYYKDGQYRTFQYLKDKLRETDVLNDFAQSDQTIAKDREFIPFLEKIRVQGDRNAHTMEIIHDPKKVWDLKDDINNYSALLVRLIHKISNKIDVC